MICKQCEKDGIGPIGMIDELCRDCASHTPGEAKACPSCGCPLVLRRKDGHPEAMPGDEWHWRLWASPGGPIVHYCPEHGCDLEAEFHLALRAKKARQP